MASPPARDVDTWRAANAGWLAAALRLLRLRLERRVIADRAAGAPGVADWLVAGDGPESAPGAPGSRADAAVGARLAWLDARIADGARALEERADSLAASSTPPAVRTLSGLAGLSGLEEQVLLLAAAPSLDGAFAAAFAEVHGDSRRDRATLHLALRLFDPGDAPITAADVLLPGRPLRRLGLVTLGRDEDEPRLLRALGIDDRVGDYLRGINRIDERLATRLAPLPVPRGDGTPRENGTPRELADRLIGRLRADPDRWPTVNLVGPRDAGALAAVSRAAAELGLRACSLDLAELAHADVYQRAAILALIGREAVLADLAVVVDASQVERGSATARVVDDLVATLNAPLILLSGERWPAGDAVLDVLAVRRPSRAEQRSLWRTALAPHANSVNGELDAIVQQFDFGPLAIGEVVDRAARDASEAITGRDLWDACRVQAGPSLDQLARRIEPAWGWDDIVVHANVRTQLRELADQVEHRARVYETWGFGAGLGRGRGITALFAGQSGTGKTMAAEIIAGQLRLDLYRIDLAGVVSKYVGETEKNLRRVFDAAESSGAILLFDEADALFGTRTEVRDSHDRYANLEINYLLQAMEDYGGLAILATNRRSALDGAFVRRLRFIVDFPFPDADARRQIWERAFPASAELDELDLGFLARLELAGGSIRSIAINAAFLAAAAGGAIGMPHVVRAAAQEYGKLSRPIGAADFGEWLTVARR